MSLRRAPCVISLHLPSGRRFEHHAKRQVAAPAASKVDETASRNLFTRWQEMRSKSCCLSENWNDDHGNFSASLCRSLMAGPPLAHSMGDRFCGGL